MKTLTDIKGTDKIKDLMHARQDQKIRSKPQTYSRKTEAEETKTTRNKRIFLSVPPNLHKMEHVERAPTTVSLEDFLQIVELAQVR